MKAYLAAVLEDLVGEYVLNISKENLKLAALRGKVKLENVELDGDFIGSHILGAVGLSGFGVLSCWARTLKINVPWTNLDASTLEIHGMHLVCVPLLPTTANRRYHGSQSLRTRAKRAALARFERNFFSGRIPGEGPQQEISSWESQTITYNGRRRRWSSSEDLGDSQEDADGIEISLSGAVQHESFNEQGATQSTAKGRGAKIPALKQKLKAKIFENLVTSVNDVHIRCEVTEGALSMSVLHGTNQSNRGISDDKAFAFGLILKSLSVRNVSENESSENGDVPARSDSGHTSMSDCDSKMYKQVEINELSIYWDHDPPFLVSESDLLNGMMQVPNETIQQRVADVMKQMSTRREPGFDAVASLSTNIPGAGRPASLAGHDYICSSFSLTMLTTTTYDDLENYLCFAEVLPCRLDLNITSQQYKQYQLLQNAMLSQQRFDTMLHQRPEASPLNDARSWWKYIIACVKHKPTSRNWEDVKKIIQCRKLYFQLVVKNLSSDKVERGGFHGGLTDSESSKLTKLENLLPVETLLSFHLVALRQVCAQRNIPTISSRQPSKISGIKSSFAKHRSSSTLGRMFSSLAGSSTSWHSLHDNETEEDDLPTFLFPPTNENGDVLLPKPRQQNGQPATEENYPTTQTTCQLQSCTVTISLFKSADRDKIVTTELDIKGSLYTSASGKGDLTFDITRFEVFDYVTPNKVSVGAKVMAVEADRLEFDSKRTVIQTMHSLKSSNVSVTSNSEVRLPPDGVVIRATAMLDVRSVTLDLSAHPSHIIWSKPAADAVAEFFSSTTQQMQNHILNRLRNAATPVAHRAQMARLYPTSLLVEIDVHAPKLWLPITDQIIDGALLVDSGKLKLSLTKAEQSSDTKWSMSATDIQILLAVQDTSSSDGNENETFDLRGVSCFRRDLTTIVHPFNICTSGHTIGSSDESLDTEMGHISVNVGLIRLTLVDVEELARSFGRFYASGVTMMKKAAEERPLAERQEQNQKSAFDIVHVCFEKIEVALESYSSRRTYLVEVHSIKFERKNKATMTFSRLVISDLKVVQLCNVNCNGSNRYLKPSGEAHHQLLTRRRAHRDDINEDNGLNAPQTPKRTHRSSQSQLMTPRPLRTTATPLALFSETFINSNEDFFIKVCHFHDLANHVDEVEFDVVSVLLRVTPASLSDLSVWLTRTIELVSIASKEIERRVHDRGRKARLKEKKGKHLTSPNAVPVEDITTAVDTSFIVRVTFNNATILVGRPASEFSSSYGKKPHDYVVQIEANASVMAQSVENEDGTGSRTLFFSSNPIYMNVAPSFHEDCLLRTEDVNALQRHYHAPDALLLNPTAIDIRIVHHTVDNGQVSFQDFSFNCESMTWSVSPHDIRVLSSVARKAAEKLHNIRLSPKDNKWGQSMQAMLHSKTKGSRIATRVRTEIHSCSLTLTRKSESGMWPLFEFNASQLKLNLEGCIDAMAGDTDMILEAQLYNHESARENVLASSHVVVVMNQLPSELALSISIPKMIDINLTASLIEQLSSHHSNLCKYDCKDKAKDTSKEEYIFINQTGLDLSIGIVGGTNERILHLDPEQDYDQRQANVPSGGTLSLNTTFTMLHASSTLFLGVKGHQLIHKLPLTSKKQCLLYKLKPHHPSGTRTCTEPVVEVVMQNQRLRQDITDASSLAKGEDLLDNSAWSPSPTPLTEKSKFDILWLSPYLEDDPGEYSDLTNTSNKKKGDFLLPDKNWMWLDDWNVEVGKDLGSRNDSDGWTYGTDFECFSKDPRSYEIGDVCRRRRLTRTRAIRSPQGEVEDRALPIVWEVRKEGNTNKIAVHSHLQIHNHTNIALSFFAFSHSWGIDRYIGRAESEQSLLEIPLQLASATHIRLAIKNESIKSHGTQPLSPRVAECIASERLLVIPTSGYTSDQIIRTSISCDFNAEGFYSMKNLHFVLTLKCVDGSVDLSIEPALKVVNLLPCLLQCQIGAIESVGRSASKITQTDSLSVSAGGEGKCLSVNCFLCPHIAVRIPGYKWSNWIKVVNRVRAVALTYGHVCDYRPTGEEEAAFFNAFDEAGEHSSIVHFDHKMSGGNPIDIIMRVEMSHTPTITFFAQFMVIDKTALGLEFTGGFIDLLSTAPEDETKRKSISIPAEKNNRYLKLDLELEGHEWCLGMNGMTLFFSREASIALSVGGSQWTSLLDISNISPVKTNIALGRYALAYNTTPCPSGFSRTRLITIFPRYQIVNLLGERLLVAQAGALSSEMSIPSHSSIQYHWDDSMLPPKIHLCSSTGHWSRGSIELDKIGVTSMRLPCPASATPMVVQVEVRMATKVEDSAVVATIWMASENTNPLYLLKNDSQHSILCRQQLSEQDSCSSDSFIWTLSPSESICFGFDEPGGLHVLQWNLMDSARLFEVDVDAMGSTVSCLLPDACELSCKIDADHATKVILFTESANEALSSNIVGDHNCDDDNDIIDIACTINLSGISISVIDNVSDSRELLLVSTEDLHMHFIQSREGFQEALLTISTLQVDNFIFEAEHPVLVYCHSDDASPFLHFSAHRSESNMTDCTLKVLDIDVSLDRKTVETLARFVEPIRKARELDRTEKDWISSFTSKMKSKSSLRVKHEVSGANSSRIYIEQFCLHPIRISLTFTQDEFEQSALTEDLVFFQLVRQMVSIADAPLSFSSFEVSNIFESPEELFQRTSAHYSGQLSSQILSILGSLLILKTPADMILDVGAGVRDFFYEPINGCVNGDISMVIEGVELGSKSLGKGVARAALSGTAGVASLVTDNCANLTSDDAFINERNMYKKKLMNALKVERGKSTLHDSFVAAGECVARSFKSGCKGLVQQPRRYAGQRGTAGLLKGVTKGLAGAVLKPIVGVGDAGVVLMNHASESTRDAYAPDRTHRRIRRALPHALADYGIYTKLTPYDEKSAKAQQLVTAGDTENDVYLWHVQIPKHLIIASDKFLWIISDKRNEPTRILWTSISNFGVYGSSIKIDVFSGRGPRSLSFDMSSRELTDVHKLLSMKLGNSSHVIDLDGSSRDTYYSNVPGIKSIQVGYIFGSVNNRQLPIEAMDLEDESTFITSCHSRVRNMDSSMPNFFRSLDLDAWMLISTIGQMFTGLSSRRCISLGILNGSRETIQSKAAKLVQGGSPCHIFATKEYDSKQGLLQPGGAMILFGWSAAPSLLQPGNVCINIETSVFEAQVTDSISHTTSAHVLPSWRVSFLEKSYDESGWWAKYWIMVQKK